MILTVVLPAAAAPDPTQGSALAQSERFANWSRAYEDLGGDSNVMVPVSSSRVFVTERIEARGLVHLDLLGGRATIELTGLDRPVDVYLLDNKPGPGKTVLAEEGDVLLRLARLRPSDGGTARVEKDFGADFFRGVEVDFLLVAEAGLDPAKSRLLYGARSYLEVLYTRQRLAGEGFVEVQPPRPERSTKSAASITAGPIIARQPHKVLVTTGLVSQDVFDGADGFFRETFEGNGRTCGSCHPAENNQTVDPAFMATLPDSDPLFVAEQRPPSDPISQLERPPLMRNFGLILENIDDLADPNVKFVMRSVPHSLSMSTSITSPNPGVIPLDRTGWSGDGAPNNGQLIDFLFGAIVQHYPNNSLDRVFKEDVPPGYPFDFRMPTTDELLDTNEFMLNAGRLNDLDLSAMTLTATGAANGLAHFTTGPANRCNICHNNAGANASFSGANNNFNTNVELVPNPAQGFQGIYFPSDGGFGGQGLASPNFDCDGDGTLDCFGDGTFNTTPLVEAADTGPFFHNDVSLTIEDAVEFYTTTTFDPVNPIVLTQTQIDEVGAFLRVINASFNLAMSIQRNEGVLVIDPQSALVPSLADFIGIRGTANKILQLSNLEIEDAVEALAGSPLGVLNPKSVELAKRAHDLNAKAIRNTNLNTRLDLVRKALEALKEANAALGSGLDYQMGEGNLLF